MIISHGTYIDNIKPNILHWTKSPQGTFQILDHSGEARQLYVYPEVLYIKI